MAAGPGRGGETGAAGGVRAKSVLCVVARKSLFHSLSERKMRECFLPTKKMLMKTEEINEERKMQFIILLH